MGGGVDVGEPVERPAELPFAEQGEPVEQGQAGRVHPGPVGAPRPPPVGLEGPVAQVVASGEAERHHCVPVVEHVDGLGQQRLDVVAQLCGAPADVDTEQGQAPQQCGGVVDVEPLRGASGADRAVVEAQHLVELAQLQVVQRPVPPVVHGEVARRPVVLGLAEEVHPVVGPPLHLEDVGQGVDGPGVVSRRPEGGAGAGLGLPVACVLLQAEGEDALDVAPPRLTRGPGRDGLLGDPQETGPVAEEEVEVLGHPEGEEVAGLVEQRPLEPVPRPDPVTLEPRAGGTQVEHLALTGTVVGPGGLLQGPRRDPEALGRGAVEGQVGAHDVAEHRSTGGRHRGVRRRPGIAGEGHQVLHRVVERRHGVRVRRLERDAPPVTELDGHGTSSRARLDARISSSHV